MFFGNMTIWRRTLPAVLLSVLFAGNNLAASSLSSVGSHPQSRFTLTGDVRWRGDPPPVGRLWIIDASTGRDQEVVFEATGPFVIEGLRRGQYHLYLLDSGLHSAFVTTVEVHRNTHVEIVVRAAAIVGEVRDSSTGAPIAGATVTMIAIPTIISDAQEARYRTDASGRLTTGPHPAGQWLFVIKAPGYATRKRPVALGDEDVDDLRIHLQPTDGLRLIFQTPDGSPPDSLTLTWFDIDEDMGFQFRRPVEDGNTAEVHWPDVAMRRGILRVSGFPSRLAGRAAITNDGKPVVVAMQGGGRVTATVPALAADDRGAVMEVFDEEGYPVVGIGGETHWTLHRRGEFWTTTLAAGVYQVVVRARDGRTWSGRTQVGPFRSAHLILQ